MVLFNYSTKEITAKIVYYGPGLCGKTTNLQFIYDNLPATINKGKMLSLATKTDRTLFFDFLPIDLGTIRGLRTRLQLYTVPGQVFYNTTRKLVLKGADGVVFVADSQKRMADANLESFRNLEDNLAEHGMKLAEMPLILQFNKRDLPDVLTLDEMNSALNRFNAPIYEAVATTGIGVHETLRAATRLVLNSLKERYAERREERVAPSVQAAALAAAQQMRAARSSAAPVLSAPPQAASPAPSAAGPAAPASRPPVLPGASHSAAATLGKAPSSAGGFSWDEEPAAGAAAAWPEADPHAGKGASWDEPLEEVDLAALEKAGSSSTGEPLSLEPDIPSLDLATGETPVLELENDDAAATHILEPAAGETPLLELADDETLTLELIEEEPSALESADRFDLPGGLLEEVPSPVNPGAEEPPDASIGLDLESLDAEEAAPIPLAVSNLDEEPFAAEPEAAAEPVVPMADQPGPDEPPAIGLHAAEPSLPAEPADDWMSRTMKADPVDDLLGHATDDLPDDSAEAAPLDLVLDDPHDDMLGIDPSMDLIARSPASRETVIAQVAPVQAACAAGAQAQEILVPIQLAIGDKSIRFDLRISLDLSAALAAASQEEPRR